MSHARSLAEQGRRIIVLLDVVVGLGGITEASQVSHGITFAEEFGFLELTDFDAVH